MRILITGASRGLGIALSTRLLRDEHLVCGFARSTTAETDGLAHEHGDRYAFFPADITDTHAMRSVIDSVCNRWGGIDVLVNNAAIGQDSLLAHTSATNISDILRVNLEAPIALTRLVVRRMLATNTPGHIITVGSISAQQGYGGLSIYAATKGGLESFTRSLSVELKGRVLANVVSPGFFASDMSSALLPEQLETIARRTPTGELTTPENVAEVIAHLVSHPSNRNGAVITVDGGASS